MGNRYFVFFCHFHLFISLNIIQNANYKGLIKESTFFFNIDERFTPQFEHDYKFSHLRILKRKGKRMPSNRDIYEMSKRSGCPVQIGMSGNPST